jgi:Spy/CpxP family protein refolding chaperone
MDGPRKDKGSGAFRMLNGLNLTPEQQSKIDAIMEQHREKLGLMHEKTEADRNALRDAIHKEVFDEQMIRKASRTLSADKEEMDVLRGRMFSEILTVLTPHQTEQLNEIRKMRREQRECREKCRHMAEE